MQQAQILSTPTRLRPGARWERFQRRYAPYIFISPFFILFAIFGLFPIVFSAYLSLHEWQPAAGLGSMKFVGLRNFTDNLTDPTFWQSLKNTGIIALESGIPQHVIAIPLAFAIHMGLKRVKGLMTALYFLPYITSVVAISVIFVTIFSWQYGVLNVLLTWLHHIPLIGGLFPAEKVNWLGNRAFVQPAVASVVVWRYVGWNVVLYLSGLQAINGDLYEAASVDGATTFQQFRSITLPLLRPIMFVAITLTLIGNLQLFEEPYIIAGDSGGIGNVALTTVMYMYRTYNFYSDAGLAAAMSWLLFILIGALTLINNRVFGKSRLSGAD
ncbi:sugar ABC transporter permease (plasmid) [Deinococcus sp. KNUC1210]|uniref:carbohydrate ABC transporter permease n=1 Tax=Deinococcus sp. KNUC1210 TaxID=2917691 RepID=UPI001EEFC433|nr:sugar ABC transporter permease [Deinococcus sp. KNUC1210]ULH14185.1 sugar ABC transporter permease [Deinococcus sp. KNUC1210]